MASCSTTAAADQRPRSAAAPHPSAPHTTPRSNHSDRTYDFPALVKSLNLCAEPTAFDMRGNTYFLTDWRTSNKIIELSANDITLCNGIIDLDCQADNVRFCISGLGFKMDAVTVRGGCVAVWIWPGGDATLNSCNIIGPCTGILVGRSTGSMNAVQALLTAHDTNITDCQGSNGVEICENGSAKLTDCIIRGSRHNAVHVLGKEKVCKLVGQRVGLHDSQKRALSIYSSSQAKMYDCLATGNSNNCHDQRCWFTGANGEDAMIVSDSDCE